METVSTYESYTTHFSSMLYVTFSREMAPFSRLFAGVDGLVCQDTMNGCYFDRLNQS